MSFLSCYYAGACYNDITHGFRHPLPPIIVPTFDVYENYCDESPSRPTSGSRRTSAWSHLTRDHQYRGRSIWKPTRGPKRTRRRKQMTMSLQKKHHIHGTARTRRRFFGTDTPDMLLLAKKNCVKKMKGFHEARGPVRLSFPTARSARPF
jgi:hypothetical protein